MASLSGRSLALLDPLRDREAVLLAIGVVSLCGALLLACLRKGKVRRGVGATDGGDRVDFDGRTTARHVAIIMDGNRRYGKAKYRNELRGHYDGGEKLVETVRWCMEAGVDMLTVYAFSTENWNREQREVDLLMATFCKYAKRCEDEARANNIRVRVLSTDPEKLPPNVAESIAKMELNTSDGKRSAPAAETAAIAEEAAKGAGVQSRESSDASEASQQPAAFQLNLCVSYGSRGDMVASAKRIAKQVRDGELRPEDVTEEVVAAGLSTAGLPDPDVLIRTSGEYRLSNFLLFECAYSELFFLDKYWPELTKEDVFRVLKEYDQKRQRRYGR